MYVLNLGILYFRLRRIDLPVGVGLPFYKWFGRAMCGGQASTAEGPLRIHYHGTISRQFVWLKPLFQLVGTHS